MYFWGNYLYIFWTNLLNCLWIITGHRKTEYSWPFVKCDVLKQQSSMVKLRVRIWKFRENGGYGELSNYKLVFSLIDIYAFQIPFLKYNFSKKNYVDGILMTCQSRRNGLERIASHCTSFCAYYILYASRTDFAYWCDILYELLGKVFLFSCQ